MPALDAPLTFLPLFPPPHYLAEVGGYDQLPQALRGGLADCELSFKQWKAKAAVAKAAAKGRGRGVGRGRGGRGRGARGAKRGVKKDSATMAKGPHGKVLDISVLGKDAGILEETVGNSTSAVSIKLGKWRTNTVLHWSSMWFWLANHVSSQSRQGLEHFSRFLRKHQEVSTITTSGGG